MGLPPARTHNMTKSLERDKETSVACIVFDVGAIKAMTAGVLTELNLAKED